MTQTYLGQQRDAMMMPHVLDGKIVGVKFKTIDRPDGKSECTQFEGSSISGLYARDHLNPNASLKGK